MTVSDDNASDSDEINIFADPHGFYPPEKPASSTVYVNKKGLDIPLRLVGHSPLWGHLLWNAGQVVAHHIEDNASSLIKDKTVLELGAGAGLPSLICALNGANSVVVTDYPDVDLIHNLQYNIDQVISQDTRHKIVAQGYLWGNDTSSLKSALENLDRGFDVLILADILFNHSEHERLIDTLRQTLKKDASARALVFFTPYRPWLLSKDLKFFELAQDTGFVVDKLFEHVMDKVMFPEDLGDEQLRRTVFAYDVRWRDRELLTE